MVDWSLPSETSTMSEPPLSVRTPAAPDRGRGNCFVVISGEGRYWDGSGWVDRWEDAQQFSFPDPDPWLSCENLCVGLRERLGVYCAVAHISRPEVHTGQGPGAA